MFRGALYSVLSAACYGSLPVLGKLAYAAGLDEYEMLLARFVFGAALLGAVLAWRGRAALKLPLRTFLAVAAVGVVVYTTQSTFFIKSLKYVPASTTSLIFYGYPITVTLLSAVFLSLKVTRWVLTSLALVSLGLGLVFYDAFLRQAEPAGLWFALGAMAVFSVYLLLCQVLLKGVPPLAMTFWMLVFTALGFSFHCNPLRLLSFNSEQLMLGLLLGLVPSALAVSLLYAAIGRVGSAYASIFSSFEPVATLAMAAMVLGEHVAAFQLVGCGLILAGIVTPNLQAVREAVRKRAPAKLPAVRNLNGSNGKQSNGSSQP